MNNYERTYLALNLLLDNLDVISDSSYIHTDIIGTNVLAREFRTVRLSGHRGSGHTTAILKTIDSRFDKCLWITPTRTLISHFALNAKNMNVTDKIEFCSIQGLERIEGRRDTFDAIIVDPYEYLASNAGKRVIDTIYGVTIPMATTTQDIPYYIFMG